MSGNKTLYTTKRCRSMTTKEEMKIDENELNKKILEFVRGKNKKWNVACSRIKRYMKEYPEEIQYINMYSIYSTTDSYFLLRHPSGKKNMIRIGVNIGATGMTRERFTPRSIFFYREITI